MATSLAAMTARRATTFTRLPFSSSTAQRRCFAGAADHHGPPKVNCWQDPMSPAKWKEEHTAVPTFLYGAAHQEGRSLDSIRRELGYFRPSSIESQWTGGSELQTLQLKPDEGPVRATQAKGVITIGATRWVDNYNIPVFTNDISIVSKIAKRVGGRGGGLPSVQSMALTHGGGTIEVACNLLEPARIGGDQVQLEVERLAK